MKKKIKNEEVLNDLSEIATSAVDLEFQLRTIVEFVTNRMESDACFISLLDERKENLILKAATGLNPKSMNRVHLKIGTGITGWVAKEKKFIALKNASADKRFLYFPESGEKNYKAILCVPILDQKNCIGILSIQSKQEKEYSKKEISLMETIAQQISGVIKNAQLYQKATRRLSELILLHEIGQALSSTLQLSDLYQLTVKNSAEITSSSIALLWILDQDKKNLLLKASFGTNDSQIKDIIKKGEGLIGRVAEENSPLLLEENKLINEGIDIISTPIKSLLCIPLCCRSRAIGVICLLNRIEKSTGEPKNYYKSDLQLISTMANHAAIAIENANIHNKLTQTNQKLLEMQEKLIQAERLSTLGRFSAEVAHEIKNPLVALGGFAYRLHKRLAEGTTEKKYSDIIVKEVERLEKLLAGILDYARIKKPKLVKIDFNKLIKNILLLYEKDLASHGIEIITNFSISEINFNLDEQQIIQVITNLLTNAHDSMEKTGGKLSLSTTDYYFSDQNKGLVFTISDTGGGIPLEVEKNIFNPFFTTKKSGTGLGLFLTKRLIEEHGGSIELKNKLGDGVTFIVRLPC